MLMMLREQRMTRRGALRLLSYALTGPLGTAACAIFVERHGVKAIFAAFMVTPGNKLKKAGHSDSEYEGHVLSIITVIIVISLEKP